MSKYDATVKAINEICGCEAVFVDESGINVNDGFDENGYVIICDDEKEIFDTLEAMYDGVSLLASIMEKRNE